MPDRFAPFPSHPPFVAAGSCLRLPLPRQARAFLFFLQLLLFFLAWAVPGKVRADDLDTLLPPSEEISTFETRRFLARFLALEEKLPEAAAIYRLLLRAEDRDVPTRRELAEILIRLNQLNEAKDHLETALTIAPADQEIRLSLAGLETTLGHFRQARELTATLCGEKMAAATSLACATLFLRWGEFYQAEAIIRQYREKHPEELAGQLALADILVGSQRLVEAEALIRLLLLDLPTMPELYARLATIKTMAKEFSGALAALAQAPASIASTPALLLAAGQANLAAHRYPEAREYFLRLSETRSPFQDAALLGLARVARGMGRETECGPLLADLLQRHPDLIDALYLAAGRGRTTADFLQALLRAANATPDSLSQWARLYAEDGLTANALACYEAALARDRDFIPARLERAQLLAGREPHDQALAELAALAAEFPTNPKILLARARALAWAKHYRESLAAYEELHALNPSDPIPRLEEARTALWGKEMPTAARIYSEFWAQPVDDQLAQSLSEFAAARTLLAEVREQDGTTLPWDGFEAFQKLLIAPSPLPLTRLELTLEPQYRLQKSAFLEKRAKDFSWNKQPSQALASYAELIALQPSNQEARFDYGQAQCALGLGDGAEQAYEELLAISPLHNLASLALARQRLQYQPTLAVEQSFWQEKGRGDLADTSRQQTDLIFELPLHRRWRLAVIAHHWNENPGGTTATISANGLGLRLAGVGNQYLRGSFELQQKRYDLATLADRSSGAGEIWFNFHDRLRLGVGLARRDESANRFALAQGIQADQRWLALLAPLSRRLELEGRAESLDYRDGINGNKGWLSSLALAYDLTDHPRQLKIKLQGEARDTRSPSLSRYQGYQLVDINHPYWTPQEYHAGGLELEWQHDLAQPQFCGARKNGYDIKVGVMTDSENNPAFRSESEYLYEFSDRWRLQLRGMLHSSREWQALGISAGIQTRF